MSTTTRSQSEKYEGLGGEAERRRKWQARQVEVHELQSRRAGRDSLRGWIEGRAWERAHVWKPAGA